MFSKANSCDGKKVYRDKPEARRIAKYRTIACGEKIHAYKCDYCGKHHIGHLPLEVIEQGNQDRLRSRVTTRLDTSLADAFILALEKIKE